MTVGIVGSEAKKFTALGEKRARTTIREILSRPKVTRVVSGACHLGGIDIWAIEIGEELGKETEEFPPQHHSWESGYKLRNMKIVLASSEVHCITVDKYPLNYDGMTFVRCYHCGSSDHIKSGGCWTMKQAAKRDKIGTLHIVKNF